MDLQTRDTFVCVKLVIKEKTVKILVRLPSHLLQVLEYSQGRRVGFWKFGSTDFRLQSLKTIFFFLRAKILSRRDFVLTFSLFARFE